jgi:JmjC domain, hydroxylase
LQVVDHPLHNLFESLPQGLSLVSMYSNMTKDAAYISIPPDQQYAELLESIKENSSGTLTPWAYFGNSGTYFPLHMEDAMIASANVLVAGSPKVWITIPFPHVEKLLQVLSRTYILLTHDKRFSHRHSLGSILCLDPPYYVCPSNISHASWNSIHRCTSSPRGSDHH